MLVIVIGGSEVVTRSWPPVGTIGRGLVRYQNSSPGGRPVRRRCRVAAPSPFSRA